MKFFETPPQNKKPEKRKKEKEIDKSRRRFLKVLGGAGLALAGTAVGVNLLEKKRGLNETGIFGDDESRYLPENFGEAEADGIFEMEEISLDDQEAVQNILGKFSLKEVRLSGTNVKQATKNYFYNKHRNDSRFSNSLENGIIEMSSWIERLKAEFQKVGVPEKFIFLALPESYWRNDKDSPAGARGYYQIMEKTGKDFRMVINDKVDQRYDPLESARVCAEHLKEIFDKTGDWDLALSGYNGGYVNRYIRYARGKKLKIDYDGFIEYMEKEINKMKKQLKEMTAWKHKVLPKETLETICKKYKADESSVMGLNNLKKDKKGKVPIVLGSRLIIPTEKMETKEVFYNKKISGFIENLNYPGKYNAIMKVIGEPDFQKKILARAEEEAKKPKLATKKS